MTTCSRISLPPQVCRLRSSSTCIVCPFVYSAQQGRGPKNVTASTPMKNQRQYIDWGVYIICAHRPPLHPSSENSRSTRRLKLTHFPSRRQLPLMNDDSPPPLFFLMLNHSPTRPTVQSFSPVFFLFIFKTKNEN